MSDLRPFQIILLGIFLAFAIGGIILFALYRGFGSEPNPYGTNVEIWGTLSQSAFSSVIQQLSDADQNFQVVNYIQKHPENFQNELVNAVAEGRGPDAIVLSSSMLISERAKLYPIPYETLGARTIRDTYVDGAEIFSLSDGTYGFPFAVDPLVMYWNRDLFATAGLAVPPATWEALTAITVPALVHISQTPIFAVTQAALAFGEYANVTHAADIIVMLAIQAGSDLITESTRGYASSFNRSSLSAGAPPAEVALDFYTQFSNPSGPMYTWNRSLPQDRNAFLAEDLALYFAPGSEYAYLAQANPNLNFDAAPVPQGSSATVRKNYGEFYALAPLRSSDNFAGTYRALQMLGMQQYAQQLAEQLGLAPVHRAVLAAGHSNPFRQTMYTSALITRGFLSPSPAGSEQVIRTMIEDVTSGRSRASEAATDAESRFNQLLP